MSPTQSAQLIVNWTNCSGTFFRSESSDGPVFEYVGEWKNGKFEGNGTYTYEDGTKYMGDWKRGKLQGSGTIIFIDGRKYVGEFKNSMMNGRGTMTYTNGKVIEGVWEHGVLEQTEEVIPPKYTQELAVPKYSKEVMAPKNKIKVALEEAKRECKLIGFKEGTEKYGMCVMRVMD